MNRLIMALLCAGFIHTANASEAMPDWLRYYQMAAERGDPEAQMKMGWAYDKGDGVKHDAKLAVDWYRRAALQNEPTAQYNLALLLIEGRDVSKDVPTGIEFLTHAAAQNLILAQTYLASLYEQGKVVEKNDAEAVKWLTRAANNGDAAAMNNQPGAEICPRRRRHA